MVYHIIEWFTPMVIPYYCIKTNYYMEINHENSTTDPTLLSRDEYY